ncbi:serine hydrolase [Streptomonospora sp. PA3]|uniref:serine hydrolase n=1 Tax=Streptomonospora sp. PA3 TaxID=2607326 RepID=UPI0012DF5FF4|nr:serine hydrolase [Streptomonospora sp. PA3]MUL42566.1 serine hydrolase [Streptomonospora sp. PA3]
MRRRPTGPGSGYVWRPPRLRTSGAGAAGRPAEQPARLAFLAAVVVSALLGAALSAVWPAPVHSRAAGTVRAAPAVEAAIETAAALGPADRARITGLLDDHLAGRPGRLALAVQELRTGAAFGYSAGTVFRTASVVKLDLVVHMLLRAEEQDRFLTDREAALAAEMIRYSDNDAADTAYEHNGFTPGFTAATRRLGLTGTRPDTGGAWGLGTTTAADRLRLLRAVFTPASPLSERGRTYVRSLMAAVAPEQAWGISAAAEPADSAEVKNGWAPAAGGGGRWVVHSTGRILRGDREYLIAVLSDRQPGYGAGVETVESAAALAVEAIARALE